MLLPDDAWFIRWKKAASLLDGAFLECNRILSQEHALSISGAVKTSFVYKADIL